MIIGINDPSIEANDATIGVNDPSIETNDATIGINDPTIKANDVTIGVNDASREVPNSIRAFSIYIVAIFGKVWQRGVNEKLQQ